MEVKMQTSFIPKKPITQSRMEGSGISLFLLLSIILFIVTVATAGAVWLWKKSISNEIEKEKTVLVAARESFGGDSGTKTIEDLIRLSNRMQLSKDLLSRHLAITPVFTLLEKNIIQNVQLKIMKFSYADSDNVKITLSGVAKNYDALSNQSDAFGSESLISQPVVSDFNLNPDGTVSFNFNALVSSKLIYYENLFSDQASSTTNNFSTSSAIQ
jgi:hypothetical protein